MTGGERLQFTVRALCRSAPGEQAGISKLVEVLKARVNIAQKDLFKLLDGTAASEVQMPVFFVPGMNREEAEKAYENFPRPQYPPVHRTARLYSIRFQREGLIAQPPWGRK